MKRCSRAGSCPGWWMKSATRCASCGAAAGQRGGGGGLGSARQRHALAGGAAHKPACGWHALRPLVLWGGGKTTLCWCASPAAPWACLRVVGSDVEHGGVQRGDGGRAGADHAPRPPARVGQQQQAHGVDCVGGGGECEIGEQGVTNAGRQCGGGQEGERRRRERRRASGGMPLHPPPSCALPRSSIPASPTAIAITSVRGVHFIALQQGACLN